MKFKCSFNNRMVKKMIRNQRSRYIASINNYNPKILYNMEKTRLFCQFLNFHKNTSHGHFKTFVT